MACDANLVVGTVPKRQRGETVLPQANISVEQAEQMIENFAKKELIKNITLKDVECFLNTINPVLKRAGLPEAKKLLLDSPDKNYHSLRLFTADSGEIGRVGYYLVTNQSSIRSVYDLTENQYTFFTEFKKPNISQKGTAIQKIYKENKDFSQIGLVNPDGSAALTPQRQSKLALQVAHAFGKTVFSSESVSLSIIMRDTFNQSYTTTEYQLKINDKNNGVVRVDSSEIKASGDDGLIIRVYIEEDNQK